MGKVDKCQNALKSMTKPIPERYPRGGPRHIRPNATANPQHRGVVKKPFRAPVKDSRATKITFETDGKVTLPYHGEGPQAKTVRQIRLVTLPDPYSAIRYSRHQFESIGAEARALDAIHRQVSGVHFEIEKNWRTFNEAQKKSVRDFLMAMAGAVGNPKQLRSYHKLLLQKRLVNSAMLLEKGKDGAALLSLSGSANDIIARKNQLTDQRVFVRRRHSILQGEATAFQNRLQKYLDDNFRRLDVLRKPSVSKKELESLLGELMNDWGSLLKKREPELKEAAAFVVAARKNIREENFREAYAAVRQANRRVIDALGRQFLMTGRFLPVISNSSQSELRKRIFMQQLSMLSKNGIFWFDRAKSRENMAIHLEEFAQASRRDLGNDRFTLIREAAQAARQNMGAVLEEKLLKAAA
jgi:hypothetical protein